MRRSYAKWTLFFAEIALLYTAFFLSYLIRDLLSPIEIFYANFTYESTSWMFPYVLGIAIPLYVLRFSLTRLRFGKQVIKVLAVSLIAVIYLFTISFTLKKFETSRAFVFIFGTLIFLILFTWRYFVFRIRRYYVKRGYDRDYLIVIGEKGVVDEYLEDIRSERERNYEISYLCYDDRFINYVDNTSNLKVIGLESIERVLREDTIDEVHIVSSSLNMKQEYEDIIKLCNEHGITVRFVPMSLSTFEANFIFEGIAGYSTFTIKPSHAKEVMLLFKRIFDIIASLIFLILLSVVMIPCAIAVKIFSKGSVIYRHKRVGINGRVFNMYKFRTMSIDVPAS
ncbi:MAG: sugar transferase [Planctomycetes bacterium]|nr:sugar transferase [Planctomycetota bacterium]